MKKQKKKSSVIELLDLVWANANRSTSFSYERLNHGMRTALSLAIGSGFEFSEGDFAHIAGNYKSGHWIGADIEWVYSDAIQVGNTSAIKDFEAWTGREAFIADKVDPAKRYGAYVHGTSTRNRERLHVGAEFPWKDCKVTVTSFAADSAYLTACTYKPTKAGWERAKIDKRFKITRADIIDDRKGRKLANPPQEETQ